MTELIKRLRDTASKGVSVWGDLQMEAAKEIEILTAERECYASAMDRMKAEVEALKADLSWLQRNLFGHSWNGVIDSGSRTHWQIWTGYRHVTANMVGNTFTEAIAAARAAQE